MSKILSNSDRQQNFGLKSDLNEDRADNSSTLISAVGPESLAIWKSTDSLLTDIARSKLKTFKFVQCVKLSDFCCTYPGLSKHANTDLTQGVTPHVNVTLSSKWPKK